MVGAINHVTDKITTEEDFIKTFIPLKWRHDSFLNRAGGGGNFQPRPQGFSLKKWVGKGRGDKVGELQLIFLAKSSLSKHYADLCIIEDSKAETNSDKPASAINPFQGLGLR